MKDDLVPLGPREAMEVWVDCQRSERAGETVATYNYRIKQFAEWCEGNGIQDLNDLTESDMRQFGRCCHTQGLTQSTLNNQLATVGLFLRYCEKQQWIPTSILSSIEFHARDGGEL